MSYDVLSLSGGQSIRRGEKYIIPLWIMKRRNMKRMVWEFLNTKYSGIVIYHQLFNLSDKLMEKFITDKGNNVIEFVRFHHGKDYRTRVSSFLKGDIKKYFDIHDIEIEMYVLEWCRDKSTKVVEM